jgi:apolipoprotein N-acyltransferase
MSRLSPILLGLLSGALLAAAYRLPGAWPLSFIALAPLLALAGQRSGAWTTFFSGSLAGFLVTGVATSWFFGVLPFHTGFADVSPLLAFLFVFTNWFLVNLVIGPSLGVWALAVRELDLSRPFGQFAAALLLPAVEFARMIAFAALSYAPHVGNPLFFSAGFLGYPLADDAGLRQLAAYGGVYVLSFVAAYANVLFYRVLMHPRSRASAGYAAALALALAVVLVLPVGMLRTSAQSEAKPGETVAILSLYTPTQEPGLNLAPYARTAETLAKDAMDAGADVVLLPEDARMLEPFSTTTYAEAFGARSASVIDSGPFGAVPGEMVVRSIADTVRGGVLVRDKQVLTPDGEYLTSLFRFIVETGGGGRAAEAFEETHGYQAGITGRPFERGTLTASLAFCLEVLKPGLGADLVREQGSGVLFVPASHALFGASPSLERDVLRFNQVQAVEAGVPLLSSVNGAPAYALDRYGRVISTAGEGGRPGFALVTLPLP